MKMIFSSGDRKFQIYENQVPGQFLDLDFALFGVDRGVLVHWQSKPAPDREWGLYDAAQNSYFSCLDFAVTPGLDSKPLSLLDGWGYVPSALIWYPTATVVQNPDSLEFSLQPAISVPARDPEYTI